jgi:uncharacterized cupredoxin-like copper-binding protein
MALCLAFAPTAANAHADEHGETSFGRAGNPARADRTVVVEARNMAFSVKTIRVREDETVRFVIKNRDHVVHDFTIGPPDVQADHRREMREMMEAHHGGEMKHDDPNAVIVGPGETAELVWHFEEAGNVEFACNVPGHYAAGMHGAFRFAHGH